MNSKSPPVLLLIDIQKGMDDLNYFGAERNNPNAENNARLLLNFWRRNNLPVIHIKHNSTSVDSPLRKGLPGNEFKNIVCPNSNEIIIEKTVNSAFIKTNLKAYLNSLQIKALITVGLTTDHCVSSTARMAANLGYEVTIVSDATATFERTNSSGQIYPAQLIHDVTLSILRDEFATVATTEQLLSLLETQNYLSTKV